MITTARLRLRRRSCERGAVAGTEYKSLPPATGGITKGGNVMAIKYHDNTAPGYPYGPDGRLLDNWDADKEYGENEYCAVFFRVENPFFDSMHQCWKDNQTWHEDSPARKRFFKQTQEVLQRFAIPEGTGGKWEGFPMEHLYIHPQDISGTVAKNKVRKIAEALDAMDDVSIRWVDVYEDISPMSEEAYRANLESKRSEIVEELLKVYETKRRNLYIVPNTLDLPEHRAIAKFHIPRRCARRSTDDETGHKFIDEIFKELVEAGKIVSAETRKGLGYRTAK